MKSTTKPIAASVYDLNRNDLEGAKAFARVRSDALTPDEAEMLLMLQDDPTALMRWFDKGAK